MASHSPFDRQFPSRPDRAEIPSRPDRAEIPSRPDRAEIPSRPDRAERSAGPNQPQERALFESLWRQFERHAPLYGCADHPDVDDEHLDLVRQSVHQQLADFARGGAERAVEQHAVRTVLTALRDSRGLAIEAPDPEIVALIEPARARLCSAARCNYVPLAELFGYHRSIRRHYAIHREAFVELIDWCVAALERPDPPDWLRRFTTAMQGLEPPMWRVRPVADEPAPVELSASASPIALAELVAAHAPAHDGEPGSSLPLVQRWYTRIRESARAAQLDRIGAEQVGDPRRLPALVENALLVHLLGLEDRRRKAVLSAAADRLLIHDFIAWSREVGSKQGRHEPVAGYLVAVIGAALRPWSFPLDRAEPLTIEQRIVLVALLAELATGKARKLLHHEKQHARAESLRTAVNRALSRLPGRVDAVSPKQRIDRVAAGFRYMNRVRRGSDPRVRDLAIVTELLG